MSRASFLRRLIHPARRPESKPSRRTRLVVEPLEDRAVPALVTVTSLADNTTTDGQVTLREALQAAETDASVDGSTAGNGADIITFASALFVGGPQTINLSIIGNHDPFFGNSAFRVMTPISIQGPTGVSSLTLAGPGQTGNLNTTMRLFKVSGNLTLDHLTLTGGVADGVEYGSFGGAIYNGGVLAVVDSTIDGNLAGASGGGLANYGSASISGSTFSNNAASSYGGGGIANAATLFVGNSTISGNNAGSEGGGIFNSANARIINTTVVQNHANIAGGGMSSAGGANPLLDNTIVAGNSRGMLNPTSDDLNAVLDAASSNNLIGDPNSSGDLTHGTNGNILGQDDGAGGRQLLDITTVFAPLADNGGPTKTYALLPGSPAIDAGNSALAVDAHGHALVTDQRGLGRDFGGTVDIGAYEARSVFTVDSLTDLDNGNYAAGDLSLREAIKLANASPGADTIDFGVTGTINLTGALPDLSSDFTITGPGANLLDVHRNTGDLYRIFTIGSGVTAAISGLTVSKGSALGGGGIYNAGTLTLSQCTLSGNSSDEGGGIYNAGTLTVSESTLSGNSGTFGGGINNQGMATVSQSTLSGNFNDSHSDGFGGGIYNFGTLTVSQSTLSGNSSRSAGGIGNFGTLTLNNSIVANSPLGGDVINNGTLTGSHNLIGSVFGGQGLTGTITGDPLLGPLADNGGPTKTFALLDGSPAINAGSDALIPAEVTTDQRGPGFPRIQGSTVDIGAFEAGATMASLSGTVFVDVHGDGSYDANDPGLDGVTLQLLDATGSTVLASTTTTGGGFYLFAGLAPGTYRIHEVQPGGVTDGAEHLGSLGGSVVANDTFQVTVGGMSGSDYDFAEAGSAPTSGESAGVGFWQNKHGQALITSGGAALANWLTTTFGNVFGNALAGASGADVAAFYKDQLFKQTGLVGTAKVDAQFMATALAVYFTDQNLAGTVAAGYGFHVTDAGLGSRVVNVGSSGAAFGVSNGTTRTVMQLLQATNAMTHGTAAGFDYVYDVNGDGVVDASEAALRLQANAMYASINNAGGI